jgi:hypothetical protein
MNRHHTNGGGAMPTEARANDVWLVEVVVDEMNVTTTHPPTQIGLISGRADASTSVDALFAWTPRWRRGDVHFECYAMEPNDDNVDDATDASSSTR